MRNFFIVILLVGQFIQGQSQDSHVVYFDTGQYDVPVIETNRLVLFIQELKDIEIERVSIYGFTDDRGSDNYNLILSQNRANAIKKIFSKFNIDDNLISNVDGKGETLFILLLVGEVLNLVDLGTDTCIEFELGFLFKTRMASRAAIRVRSKEDIRFFALSNSSFNKETFKFAD